MPPDLVRVLVEMQRLVKRFFCIYLPVNSGNLLNQVCFLSNDVLGGNWSVYSYVPKVVY